MTVIYFTATGNSLAVAKRISDKCVSAAGLSAQEGPIELSDPDGVGFVMPVYFGQIPDLFVRLMGRIKIDAPYIFAVLTYGEIAGRAALHIRRLGESNGIRFDYIRTLKMVDNNFTIVNVEKQVRNAGRKKIPAQMETIAGDVRLRKKFIEKPGFADRIVGLVEELMPQGRKFDSRFRVESERCNGCGSCVKVCPMGNVRLADGRPEWLGNCMKCTACYHNCPQGAIRYQKEKSRFCFRNPEVSLMEIIRANCRE